MFKGHVAELLRHPQGCHVIVDVYDVASSSQRNAMASEFYGREFALFGGVDQSGEGLASLGQLLAAVPAPKRRFIFQHMTRALEPVMEKALLHPPLAHRCARVLSFSRALGPFAFRPAHARALPPALRILQQLHSRAPAS